MRQVWMIAVLLGWTGVSWAGPNDVVVDKVWVGESVPGQDSATLELNITTVAAARLLGISSPVAGKVEIHSMAQHHGKMQAVVVDSLALPPHQTTAFGSHRLFLIMAGLKKELNAGETVPVTLEVEYANKRRQTVNATATVKKMALSYKHLGPGEVHDHR